MKRTHLLPVPAALLVVALGACTSGPPRNASIEDFCSAMDAYWVSAESTDMADHVAAAEQLSASGTPEGAPRQAVDGVASLRAWLESDRDGETVYVATMTSDQRRDLSDMDLWAQLTCSTGEIADLEDHPSYTPRPGS